MTEALARRPHRAGYGARTNAPRAPNRSHRPLTLIELWVLDEPRTWTAILGERTRQGHQQSASAIRWREGIIDAEERGLARWNPVTKEWSLTALGRAEVRRGAD